jgi:uncharacterized membrane protein YhaH (DUF805 family)
MFKDPFSFEGRIRRTEYGISVIIYASIVVLISLIVESSNGDAAFLLIAYIPLLWFLWAQSAKRCHDVGNSGWWQLIPLYGFWLLFQDGDAGTNQYGDNPKGIQSGGNVNQNVSNQNNYSSINTNNSNQTTTSGYNSGGYNGGHNNHSNNNSASYNNQQNNSANKSGEYKKGDLYN